jgi:hypothetical protein
MRDRRSLVGLTIDGDDCIVASLSINWVDEMKSVAQTKRVFDHSKKQTDTQTNRSTSQYYLADRRVRCVREQIRPRVESIKAFDDIVFVGLLTKYIQSNNNKTDDDDEQNQTRRNEMICVMRTAFAA